MTMLPQLFATGHQIKAGQHTLRILETGRERKNQFAIAAELVDRPEPARLVSLDSYYTWQIMLHTTGPILVQVLAEIDIGQNAWRSLVDSPTGNVVTGWITGSGFFIDATRMSNQQKESMYVLENVVLMDRDSEPDPVGGLIDRLFDSGQTVDSHDALRALETAGRYWPETVGILSGIVSAWPGVEISREVRLMAMMMA